MKPVDKHIIDLQEQLAYQALALQKMSDEMYAQQKEIAALKSQLLRMHKQMEAMTPENGAPELPPPHY